MKKHGPLVVGVADLLRSPGSHREVELAGSDEQGAVHPPSGRVDGRVDGRYQLIHLGSVLLGHHRDRRQHRRAVAPVPVPPGAMPRGRRVTLHRRLLPVARRERSHPESHQPTDHGHFAERTPQQVRVLHPVDEFVLEQIGADQGAAEVVGDQPADDPRLEDVAAHLLEPFLCEESIGWSSVDKDNMRRWLRRLCQ